MFGLSFEKMLSLVLLCIGIGGVVYLVYMLISILNQQEKIFEEIKKGQSDLIGAGQRLNNMFGIAEEFMQMAKKPPTPPKAVAKEEKNNDDSVQKFESIMAEMRGLVNTIKGNLEEELSKQLQRIPDISAEKLSKMSQPELSSELNHMSKAIDRVLQDIKRHNHILNEDNETIKELKQKIEGYQRMIMQSREKTKSAEATIANLEKQIAQLQMAPAETRIEQVPGDGQLKKDLEQLLMERDMLKRQIDGLQDEIARTKIEKDFIENRFIDLA